MLGIVMKTAKPINVFPKAFADKVHEEVFGNLNTYFRDTHLPLAQFRLYEPGLLIQEIGYMDVTTLEGGLIGNVRYIIHTPQSKSFKRSAGQYESWTIPQGAYFKVIDVHANRTFGLVTLLQIPEYAIPYFALNQHSSEAGLVIDGRRRFEAMIDIAPHPALKDDYWIRRTAFPIGINANGGYCYRFDYADQPERDPLHKPKGFFQRWFRK